MSETRVCAEGDRRPNLCEVTCRRKTVGRAPCEVVCNPMPEVRQRILGWNLAEHAELGDLVIAPNKAMYRKTEDGLEKIVPVDGGVVYGFDGSRSPDTPLTILQPDAAASGRMAVRSSAGTHPMGDEMLAATPLKPFLVNWQEQIRVWADMYERPTFFNQPVGVDADDTPVYWSDLVDGNIAPSEVRITL